MWPITGFLVSNLMIHVLASGPVTHNVKSAVGESPYDVSAVGSKRAVVDPKVASPGLTAAPFVAPFPYQAQQAAYSFRQYPYFPAPPAFYPPQQQQQIYYPGQLAPPSSAIYIPRYPAEGTGQQGGTGVPGGWGSYFPSWGNFFGNLPFGGSSQSESGTSSPATGAAGAAGAAEGPTQGASGNKNEKPEKLEVQEESGKSAVEKSDQPTQQPQYVLLGQPQFYGHFAAFPDRDPTSLPGASNGAISSFLFYQDQPQQVPVKENEIPNIPASASLAYQRFLLLSKHREDNQKKPVKPTQLLQQTSQSTLNSQSLAPVETSSSGGSGKNAEENIAQAAPNAIAYAGIGGVAGASPVGTALTGQGVASAAPHATAIAGTSDQDPDFQVVPAKKVAIAKYTAERGYHIDNI